MAEALMVLHPVDSLYIQGRTHYNRPDKIPLQPDVLPTETQVCNRHPEQPTLPDASAHPHEYS